MVQISGKTLIASKSTMVGARKIQAPARSERPDMRRDGALRSATAEGAARRCGSIETSIVGLSRDSHHFAGAQEDPSSASLPRRRRCFPKGSLSLAGEGGALRADEGSDG